MHIHVSNACTPFVAAHGRPLHMCHPRTARLLPASIDALYCPREWCAVRPEVSMAMGPPKLLSSECGSLHCGLRLASARMAQSSLMMGGAIACDVGGAAGAADGARGGGESCRATLEGAAVVEEPAAAEFSGAVAGVVATAAEAAGDGVAARNRARTSPETITCLPRVRCWRARAFSRFCASPGIRMAHEAPAGRCSSSSLSDSLSDVSGFKYSPSRASSVSLSSRLRFGRCPLAALRLAPRLLGFGGMLSPDANSQQNRTAHRSGADLQTDSRVIGT